MSQQRLTSSGTGNHAIQSYYSTEASPYDPSQFQNDEANLTELTHDENEKNKQSKFKESILLYVATVVMVLARSVDFVLYVRMTKKMRNYEYMLADVFLSLGFCFVSWPVTWFKMYRGTISKEMRAFPSYKFIVMGIMDSLNTLISTIPSAFVSGPVNVLMSQSVVFINMVASFIFLHFRYNVYHIGGVLLVLIGIIIDIFPMFANSSGGDDPNAWLWILLLFVANIPAAASNVYKEKYLKEANLDVFYLNSWVALYQFIFGLMSAFTVFIPLPDGSGPPKAQVDPASLYEYIWSGIKCFFGFNSVLSDQCEYFWAVFIIFICFNMTYNILLLVVFKRGSSTLAVVASVARLALSNFGFLIKFLAGEAYLAALSPFDIIALVILILGIIIYSLTTEKVAESNDPLMKMYSYCWSFLPSFDRKKNKTAFDDEEDVYH